MSKLSLSQAWDETKAILAHDGRLFIPVALATFVLPGLILGVSAPVSEPGKLPPAGPWMAVAITAVIVSLIGQLAVMRLAMEPHVSVGEALAHGARRLLSYVAAWLLWLLPIVVAATALYDVLLAHEDRPPMAAALGLMLVTAVGVYVAVRMMLTSAVASAERVGPVTILRRSWELSRGNWWRLFAFMLLFGIGALALLLAVDSIAALAVRLVTADAGPRSLGGLLVSILSQLVTAILSVVFFVMMARIYVQRSGSDGVTQVSVPSSGT
jgi:hypothetical protein